MVRLRWMAVLPTGMQRSKARSPGPGERAMAASALAALAFVLAWVCAQQARFDPAVMIAAAGTAAAPPQPSASLLEKWPDGFSPMGAAETFTPGTLSDKID